MAKTDLSLGKLRRATDPANVSSNTTADSTLRGNAAGADSGNNFKISEFAIDEVSSSLSGSRFMDEGTAETYKLEFKSVGEREEILIDKNIEIDTINKLDNLINN